LNSPSRTRFEALGKRVPRDAAPFSSSTLAFLRQPVEPFSSTLDAAPMCNQQRRMYKVQRSPASAQPRRGADCNLSSLDGMDKVVISDMENLGGRANRTFRDIEHFCGLAWADAMVRQICRAYFVLVVAGYHVRQLGRDREALPHRSDGDEAGSVDDRADRIRALVLLELHSPAHR